MDTVLLPDMAKPRVADIESLNSLAERVVYASHHEIDYVIDLCRDAPPDAEAASDQTAVCFPRGS